MNNKELQLLDLAKKRQATRFDGYSAIGDYNDGVWECDYVSPYSKSAHNVNADVMVILQDWCSEESFSDKVCEEELELGYALNTKTNTRLKDYLKRYFGLVLADTYTTNLFPFIKKGSMSANIPIKDMKKAATEFTWPMINIIQPKIVIGLGRKTYDALWDTCENKADAIKGSFSYGNTKIFHQPHPAARISNIQKEKSWTDMKSYLNNVNAKI